MMTGVYIGRRGEGGKSEDVKKMEMSLGPVSLLYSISPYFPAGVPGLRTFYAPGPQPLL